MIFNNKNDCIQSITRAVEGTFGGWASQAWRKRLSTTTRQVAFYHRSKNFDVCVEMLTHNLSSLNVAA
jgi:hypothetical protein